jgi:glutamate 5-kinase
MTAQLKNMRRLVVKIGSLLLVESKTGHLNTGWLAALGDDIAKLRKAGCEMLVVSSGAIALGRSALGLGARALKLEESQAAAAAGQITLAHAWRDALARHGISAAQILLTLNDTEERRRYLNARGTLNTLLKLGAVPVINENDTVATSEIRYGDNDRLAARVAGMMSADCLILLSDVDGFYTASPKPGGKARLIEQVDEITPEIEAMAGDSENEYSSGGMVTKLEAAKIATRAGAHMVIASGHDDHALDALANGGKGSWFVASASPAAARKRWIAGSLEPAGALTVDAGAARALASGKSLLPAGITDVAGSFLRGDAVAVLGPGGVELGRGLSAYDHSDARRIIGHKSDEIENILGYRGRNEMIHRDDLFLTKG